MDVQYSEEDLRLINQIGCTRSQGKTHQVTRPCRSSFPARVVGLEADPCPVNRWKMDFQDSNDGRGSVSG